MASNGPRQFVPILLVQAIGTLGFSIALPILVYLVRDLGGAAWTYGFVGATYSAFQLVGAPVLGRWSDRIGRRRVLLVSQAGTLAGWLLFLVALSLRKTNVARFAGASLTVPLLVVFAARAVDGLTGGNVSVANAYVADLTVDDAATRQRAYGWMGMAASVGFSIGPGISGALSATRFGYRAPVLAAAVISGMATLMCFALPEASPRADGSPLQPTVTKLLGQQQRRCDRVPEPLSGAARARPGVRRLLVATFILFVAFNVFYAIFPVRAAADLAWSPSALGAFFVALSLGLIAAEGPLLDFVAKRVSGPGLFAAGMLALGLAFVTFAADASWVVFMGAALFALGNGVAWPIFQARIADAAGPSAQGFVQGAAASASSLASIVGLIAGGVLYMWLGRSLFVVAAVLFVALGLAARLLFAPRAGRA
jgi:MFS transporter, DHA1 family, tetracycline resistance protein